MRLAFLKVTRAVATSYNGLSVSGQSAWYCSSPNMISLGRGSVIAQSHLIGELFCTDLNGIQAAVIIGDVLSEQGWRLMRTTVGGESGGADAREGAVT